MVNGFVYAAGRSLGANLTVGVELRLRRGRDSGSRPVRGEVVLRIRAALQAAGPVLVVAQALFALGDLPGADTFEAGEGAAGVGCDPHVDHG